MKCGCCDVHPYPFTGAIFRTAAECVKNGRVTPLHPGIAEGVVFVYEFISALLAVACEVAVSE